MQRLLTFVFGCLFIFHSTQAHALTAGAIDGTITDDQGTAVSNAEVKLQNAGGKSIATKNTSKNGEFEFYPVDFGDYSLIVNVPGFKTSTTAVHISSGGHVDLPVALVSSNTTAAEAVMVEGSIKRNRIDGSSPTSSREVDQQMIEDLPQGDDVKLPKLIATTTPGVVQGPFGQTFIRGNHANIQYQIDGVQLPDSPSSTFGQAFSPRNIDHMEVITGGIPAEYGERLAGVVNIITKTGGEVPGGTAEVGYGAYHTLSPQANYSGSNSAGDFHYYVSGAFTKTDRGIDTPQPKSLTDITQGGKEAIHDDSNANDQFLKLDWQASTLDRLTFVAYSSYSLYQIPNMPSSFGPDDSIFIQPDQFGNDPLHFVPYNTNDTQAENNAYAQMVWKHSLDSKSFFQIAPYYKFSKLNVGNDLSNDLFAATYAPNPSDSSSFAMNRVTNNFGIKGDYSNRLSDAHLLKAGFQIQNSSTTGNTNVWFQQAGTPAFTESSDNSPQSGDFESLYVQDEFKISKKLTLNAGVRVDGTQFLFADSSTQDSWVQPRIGLSYLVTETTKIHAFYGLLFQPAPIEDLRASFRLVDGATIQPYDIKAEKDNYFEVGVSQQFGDQIINLNTYYKSAKNMLDDSQLLNTSIAQPYNFAVGYAYGVELSVEGKIVPGLTDYFNYSYEIAKGKGISGGIFALAPGDISTGYQYLDHVQIQTANAGLTYRRDRWSLTGQGFYGSGLRTGPGNSLSLPGHFTTDASATYDFSGDSWLSKTKLSVDLLNITDNVYPITIANGFNGSHYAAGRELFIRLSKEL